MRIIFDIKNHFKKAIALFVALLLSFSFSSNFALSQVNTTDALTINISPKSPKVGEKFTAEIVSYAVDLDRCDITWLLDNKVIKTGFGEKTIDLTMLRGSKNLLVKAVSSAGKTYVGGISMVEKSVNIVWEGADSYVPEWYDGKRQVSSGGTLRAVAIANIDDGNGKYLPNDDLIFTWEVNGEIQNKVSGLGKYYADLFMADEYGSTAEITVTVKTKKTGAQITESIDVPISNTDLLVYKNDKVYGLVQRAIMGGINITDKNDTEMIAEPYFFSTDRFKNSGMKYSWVMNGKALSGNNYSRTFQFGDNTGSTNITVSAEHLKKIMQDAKRSFTISF